MPNLVAALARKWCPCHSKMGDDAFTCICEAITAAVQETLEMAEKTPPQPCSACVHDGCKDVRKKNAAIAALKDSN